MEAWIELDASKAVIQRVVPELLDHSKQHYQEAFLSCSIGWKYHLGRRTWSTTSLVDSILAEQLLLHIAPFKQIAVNIVQGW